MPGPAGPATTPTPTARRFVIQAAGGPLFNVRPGFPNWLTGSYRHFPVDMYIIEWLEHVGIAYHVATDEDFEREGRGLTDRYATIVTGSHPEYWTRKGLDTLEGYLNEGGRTMYLGGNRFTRSPAVSKQSRGSIEVRRDNSGTRCWDAPYGERTHVATSEAGRHLALAGPRAQQNARCRLCVGRMVQGLRLSAPRRKLTIHPQQACSPV